MTSSPSFIAVLAIALAGVAVFLARRLAQPGVGRALARAIDAADATPLLQALSALKPNTQPEAFNTTIRKLWDRYERDLAAQLIVALGRDHSDKKIAQYWMRQLLTSEPRLAKLLTPEFLAAHYNPEIAAQCGAVG